MEFAEIEITEIGITGIDHVGIAVPDLDLAIEEYTRNWGMALSHREVNAEQGVSEAMLTVGDSQIQLLAPYGEDSPLARFLDTRGPGVQQVAYRVTDIDRACALLKQRGMRLIYEEPRRGTLGSRINFVHPASAGGVLIELVEPPQQQ